MPDHGVIEEVFLVGTRVRNYGEQYSNAIRLGTASVIGSKIASGGHVEYQVQRDRAVPGIPNPTWWAAHRTIKALSQ